MNFDKIFPDNREEGETTIRQCQLVMLRMLKIFDYLCNRHNIKYFLTGGSLIGAVRHKGFIPWDDDLDVGMTRENYEKFILHAVPALPKDIFFQTPQTDPHYMAVNVDARLRDKYSSYTHIKKTNIKCHLGLQLDIFVYDRSYLPHNFFVITQTKILKYLNPDNRVKVLKWISKHSPLRLVYGSNFIQDYSMINSATYIRENEYSTLIRAQFEDMEALIPKGWHSYLERQYGDYMQLPPVEKRVSNHKVIINPFTPCEHHETLQWEKRNIVTKTDH